LASQSSRQKLASPTQAEAGDSVVPSQPRYLVASHAQDATEEETDLISLRYAPFSDRSEFFDSPAGEGKAMQV
jgi:hypothetical protein